MKTTMKFSGIISTILLIVGTLFKINHWPGASIIIALGFISLCFVFLPSVNYVMHREKRDRSLILLFLSAFLGSFGFFLGILFKIQHWPGAGPLMTFGTLILCLLFFPLLLRYLFRKAESGMEKTVYTIGVLTGIIFMAGVLFKAMHWPGGSIVQSAAALILAVFFIPLYTHVKFKQSKHIESGFIYFMAAVSWVCMFAMLVSLSGSRNILPNLYTSQQKLLHQKTSFHSNSESIYKLVQNSEEISSFNNAKLIADDLDKYIQNLKMEIIQGLDEENIRYAENTDNIDIRGLSGNTSTMPVHFVMIGEEQNGKAFELKNKIDKTRQEFLNLVDQDETAGPIINSCFNTELPEGTPERYVSWEMLYFNHSTVMGCLEVLTSIQRNLRIAENEVITHLLNSQNQAL